MLLIRLDVPRERAVCWPVKLKTAPTISLVDVAVAVEHGDDGG